ncbi:MAG: 23S rRNA (pseudouridine(1915)-N(3))-methyltransferase RlmH [Pseudomonadota bacterium]
MRLSINAIGKQRRGPEADLVSDYIQRAENMARPLGFSGLALKEYEAARGLSGEKRQEAESQWALDNAEGAKILALDERGDQISSKALADMLAKLRDEGAQQAAFLIGGADGHAPRIADAAHRLIAFGRATWPHMLVRAMLAEQIYRSMTILAGHPYHRQ